MPLSTGEKSLVIPQEEMKEKIRDQIRSYLGKRLKFKYNGARNQNEEFSGRIENAYSNVFTISCCKIIMY